MSLKLRTDSLGRTEIVGDLDLPSPGYFMATDRPALATTMHRWIDNQGVSPDAMGSGIPPADLHRFMLRRRQRISGVGRQENIMYLKKDSLGRTEIVGSGELRSSPVGADVVPQGDNRLHLFTPKQIQAALDKLTANIQTLTEKVYAARNAGALSEGVLVNFISFHRYFHLWKQNTFTSSWFLIPLPKTWTGTTMLAVGAFQNTINEWNSFIDKLLASKKAGRTYTVNSTPPNKPSDNPKDNYVPVYKEPIEIQGQVITAPGTK